MKGKKRTRRPALYLSIVAIVIAVFTVAHFKSNAKQKPIIETAAVERGTVTASVSATGTLQPLTTVEVKSNVAGQIVKLAVDEGDEVKAGQLIAKIDPTDTVTALQQNQADLASAVSKVNQAREQLAMQHQQNSSQIESASEALEAAKAKLTQAIEQAKVQPQLTSAAIAQARSSYSAQQSSLKQLREALIPQQLTSAQASYDQSKTSFAAAEKDLARQKELLAKGFVSKSSVEASESSYSAAKAQLDNATSKRETIKNETDQDLAAAEAKTAQAKAELDNALSNSVQNQLKQHEVTAAKAALKQAEAALQSAHAGSTQDQINSGNIIQANAQVKKSQAAVKNAITELGYTTVVAPRSGIVTEKYAEEGSIVTAGRSSFAGSGSGVAIVDIADTSQMSALVNVDETDIAQIEIGQDVDITVEAYPDELFTGKVTKIAPQSVTESNVTTIPVTVQIDMPDKRLKPGMNATCDFITGRSEDVLMVPTEAVNEGDNGNTVQVLVNGKPVTRKVETGLEGGDYTEIVSGLKEGEKVVTSIVDPTATAKTTTTMGGSSTGSQRRSGGFGGPGMGMGGGPR